MFAAAAAALLLELCLFSKVVLGVHYVCVKQCTLGRVTVPMLHQGQASLICVLVVSWLSDSSQSRMLLRSN